MQELSNVSFPITDRIFLGEGLFETIKVFQCKPCFAQLHWQRLKNAADMLALSFTLPLELWNELLLKKIEQDKLTFGGIKVFFSAGVAPRGFTEKGVDGQLALQSFRVSAAEKPVRLISSSWLRDQDNPIYRFKTINCLESIIARREAMAKPADDVLFFNTKQHATESTCANLFVINKNHVLTPPLMDGLLAGITRSRILKLCAQKKYAYKEVSITKEMLFESDSIFLSSALQGVQYVQSFDNHLFSSCNERVEQIKFLLNEELRFK